MEASTLQIVPTDIDRIGDRIDLLGLKRKYVAKKVGVTEVWFSYVMNGKQPLGEDLRKKIFDYLDLS